MEDTKASKTKLNSIESKMNSSDPCGFYFSVWCYEAGYTSIAPWKIQQIVAQDMQTAAEMFVQDYDKKTDRFFAKNWNKIKNMIIWVQDWRGRIAKFEIEVETKPVYYARRIK